MAPIHVHVINTTGDPFFYLLCSVVAMANYPNSSP